MRSIRCLTMFAALCTAGPTAADTLADLQWQHRVIAVFTATDGDATAARETLEHTAGIAERDIAWFVIEPNGTTSNIDSHIDQKSLIKLHARSGFEAVLVGKDGDVKSRQTGALDLESFFDNIDAMPMRRREMQSSP